MITSRRPSALLALAFAAAAAAAGCGSPLPAQESSPRSDDSALDRALADTHPAVRKWATVVRVRDPEGEPSFEWHHFGDSADAVDFWPASTIKLYTVVAVAEWLRSEGLPLDSTLVFSRRDSNGSWIQDCARTYPEMVSEVFRRSSNEDYTLLLRTVGIDSINTRFLIPAKGFPHTALMRDYVTYRPVIYENDEPQRVVVLPPGDDAKPRSFEHTWSGKSYAAERGATALNSTTGNCTSTRELAECLRRVVFHDRIPERERYAISSADAKWITYGDRERGVVGLENRAAGAFGWSDSGEKVFPNARYFHKGGQISSYSLDLCYLSDAKSGMHLILAFAVESGRDEIASDVALAIYRAAAAGAFH